MGALKLYDISFLFSWFLRSRCIKQAKWKKMWHQRHCRSGLGGDFKSVFKARTRVGLLIDHPSWIMDLRSHDRCLKSAPLPFFSFLFSLLSLPITMYFNNKRSIFNIAEFFPFSPLPTKQNHQTPNVSFSFSPSRSNSIADASDMGMMKCPSIRRPESIYLP